MVQQHRPPRDRQLLEQTARVLDQMRSGLERYAARADAAPQFVDERNEQLRCLYQLAERTAQLIDQASRPQQEADADLDRLLSMPDAYLLDGDLLHYEFDDLLRRESYRYLKRLQRALHRTVPDPVTRHFNNYLDFYLLRTCNNYEV